MYILAVITVHIKNANIELANYQCVIVGEAKTKSHAHCARCQDDLRSNNAWSFAQA